MNAIVDSFVHGDSPGSNVQIILSTLGRVALDVALDEGMVA